VSQSIAAKDITLGELKQNFGIRQVQNSTFELKELDPLNDQDRRLLDRVKSNFLELMDEPPILENTVKLVVIAPLLDLAGFYHKPFRIETETSVAIEMQDEGITIRGRIDILVLKKRLWLLVIESKRSDFAVTRAVPQALAYMLSNSDTDKPTFGMITNGNEFLFLKVFQQEYSNSRLFALMNPNNELYTVLQMLKQLGIEAIA
jgi:predicted type IV restriction endonuclease